MAITGTCIIKFNSTTPLTCHGAWSVNFGIPVSSYYGQGTSGLPGSGYLGRAKGTAQNVGGSFEFAIDEEGEEIKTRLLQEQSSPSFFTAAWPIGDPLASQHSMQAVDCHWDNLVINADNPNGKLIISGTMSAGKVTFFE